MTDETNSISCLNLLSAVPPGDVQLWFAVPRERRGASTHRHIDHEDLRSHRVGYHLGSIIFTE